MVATHSARAEGGGVVKCNIVGLAALLGIMFIGFSSGYFTARDHYRKQPPTMTTKITHEHLGKRLLVTDPYWERDRNEIKILEVSPSGDHLKIQHRAGLVRWCRVVEYKIIEVLSDAPIPAWNGNSGDALIALLKTKGIET